MKQGRSISDLALELERQAEAKKDFMVPVSAMGMQGNGQISFGESPVEFTRHAHGQVADFLGIPRSYYEKMRKENHFELLSENVNHWLSTHQDKKRMIRTLDGYGRAFLSSRYRRLDNKEVAETVLPVLVDQEVQIMSSEITDRKMFIKAVFPKIQGDVAEGDVVQSGIIISNSEIGAGSLLVQPLIYRLVCENGMILPDSKLNKYHIGRVNSPESKIAHLLTSETLDANDKAFFLSVRDVVKSCFEIDLFNGSLNKLREASGIKIESKKIEKVVEVTQKKFNISESNGSSILQHLIEGGDLSKYGLANAVTRASSDVENYDDATDMEEIGGKIINLTSGEWKTISEVS